MKPILFAFGSETSYRLQKLVAERCAARGRAVGFVYDRPADAFFARVKSEAAALGGTARSLDDEVVAGSRPAAVFGTSVKARLFKAVLAAHRMDLRLEADTSRRGRLLKAFLVGPLAAGAERRAEAFIGLVLARLAAAEKLLDSIDPGVLVVSEDGISGPLALVAAAHQRGLSVVDVPFGYGTREDFDVALEHKAEHGEILRPTRWERALLRLLAPGWLKTGAYEGAVLFPPELIFAYEAHGLSLRDAWIVHGGHADRQLAESRQMLELYRREGIPKGKPVLTGSPYCDTMLDGARAEPAALEALRQPRRIEAGKTRVLVSWPPSYHGSRGAFSEFPTYREMTVAILGWLAGLPDCRVTVSMHPACAPEDRAAVAEAGLVPSDEYVIRLIARHDVYVSYYSSTIRWAIAAGKPVVNYDAYKLGLGVYEAAPGFVNAPDLPLFKERMGALVGSEEAFVAAARRQIEVAEDWGAIDGRNTERVVAQIEALSR